MSLSLKILIFVRFNFKVRENLGRAVSFFAFRPALRHIDGQGIFYHAHYFGFADEARTEFLREMNYPPSRWQEEGVTFVVRKCEARYLHPLRFDDQITIETTVDAWTPMSIQLSHSFLKEKFVMAQLSVQLVCVNTSLGLHRLPLTIQKALNDKFIEFKGYHGEK